MSIHTMPPPSRIRNSFLEAMVQKIDVGEDDYDGVQRPGTSSETTLKMVDRQQSDDAGGHIFNRTIDSATSSMKHNGDVLVPNGFSQTHGDGDDGSGCNDLNSDHEPDDSSRESAQHLKLRKAILSKKDELKSGHRNKTTTTTTTGPAGSSCSSTTTGDTSNLQHLISREFYYDF